MKREQQQQQQQQSTEQMNLKDFTLQDMQLASLEVFSAHLKDFQARDLSILQSTFKEQLAKGVTLTHYEVEKICILDGYLGEKFLNKIKSVAAEFEGNRSDW